MRQLFTKFAFVAIGSLALFCLLVIPGNSFARDSNDTSSAPDHIFDEIELTPDGVVARDSSGQRWNYDFATENFKPGRARRGPTEYNDGTDVELANNIPVETRCTEELFVGDNESHVLVGIDEYVDGDIRSLGRVRVRGWVKGSIHSTSRVMVWESGQVDGDIRAPEIQVKDGAVVLGRIIETNRFVDLQNEMIGYSRSLSGIWIVFGFAVILLLCGFLILTLAPTKFRNVNACIKGHPIRCYLLGFLLTILMPMVMLLVIVTIVGILVVWMVPIAYLCAYVMGLVSVCGLVGRGVVIRLQGSPRTDLVHYLAGLACLIILWLVVAILLGAPDEVSYGFGIFFLVISIIVSNFPIMAGVGAAFLTRFGLREYVSFGDESRSGHSGATVPAPPPIAPEPPITPPGPATRPVDESAPNLPGKNQPSPPTPHGPPPIIIPPPPPKGESDSEN